MCLLRSSQPRLSSVSVVFDFNDSLNDVAPLSPMVLSVVVRKRNNSELFMYFFCECLLSFVFTTQAEVSECCV